MRKLKNIVKHLIESWGHTPTWKVYVLCTFMVLNNIILVLGFKWALTHKTPKELECHQVLAELVIEQLGCRCGGSENFFQTLHRKMQLKKKK